MGKIRRHGYIFMWHVADHLPVHIHVYKGRRLVCRWRLLDELELSGRASAKLKKIISQLRNEGVFESIEKAHP
jgi:hypothetical protein